LLRRLPLRFRHFARPCNRLPTKEFFQPQWHVILTKNEWGKCPYVVMPLSDCAAKVVLLSRSPFIVIPAQAGTQAGGNVRNRGSSLSRLN
jgi:hypothetical protein